METSKLLKSLKDSDDPIRKECYYTITSLELEVEKLHALIETTKRFAEWVECVGRTDCEVYKHELRGNADLALKRIETTLE